MTKKQAYVTTTIPFVNAKPHVGFALELVQADAFARYCRLVGKQVRFQTGTDENAFKNVLAARELEISTTDFVTRNSHAFRHLCETLNISHDRFIRTTEPEHRAGVEWFWQRLGKNDLFLKKYKGLYCVGCEDFFFEKDLVDGFCPDHEKRPVVVEEENYFFRLSAYQEQLERVLTTGELRVIPESRRNEVLQFVRSGLQDISVSRTSGRLGGWGIPVPGDPSHTIYVWIDALINYLSGLGCADVPAKQDVWNEDTSKIHIIGKNVWKFHAVYWPALLLSAGLPLPDQIVVHGFLTQNGRKISKSLGNSIDPTAYVNEFGIDAVRYYLLRHIRPAEDGDFSTERLSAAYDDLANGLGNLLSRLTALCEKAGYGSFVSPPNPAAPTGFHSALERFEYDRGILLLWDSVRTLNQDIELAAPWNLPHRGAKDQLRTKLTGWLERLYGVAHWLQPFLPDASAKIKATLSAQPLTKSRPLFPSRR